MPPAAGASSSSEEDELREEEELEQEEELANRISQSVVVHSKFLAPGRGEGKKPRKGGSKAWDDTRLQRRVDGYEDVFKGEKTTHFCIFPMGPGNRCNTELTLSKWNRSYSTGRIVEHHKKKHPDSDVAKASGANLKKKRKAVGAAMQASGGVEIRPAVGGGRACRTRGKF
jgi:hypothetical protein